MRILDESQLLNILARFNFDKKVLYQKCVKCEPDCFLYVFASKDAQYALICRDLIQDDLEAEQRILKAETGIEVTEHFTTKNDNNYWLQVKELDDFDYIFSLIGFVGDFNFNPTYFTFNETGRS